MVLKGKQKCGTLGYFAKMGNEVGIIGNQHYLTCPENVKTVMVKHKCVSDHEIAVGTVKHEGDSSYKHGLDCCFAVLNECVRKEIMLTNGKVVRGVIKDDKQLRDVVDDRVYFCGSTTNEVKGFLKSYSYCTKINGIKFKDQIRLDKPLEGGDSGALVVTEEGDVAVGLIFASDGGIAIANYIHKCEAFLKVDLLVGGQ